MGKVLQLIDGVRNAITGAGTRRDPRSYSAYAAPLALTQQDIDAAYRGSGLMRKIIQIPALDMVREWRDWKAEAKQITALEAEEKRLGIREKVRQAEVLRGLGGGALILGLPGFLDQPVPATVGTKALAFVHVVSRWHLNFDEIEDDARLSGYGEPRMWKLNSAAGQQQAIHPSRVIAFRADTSAMLAATGSIGTGADAFWGESTVAQVLDAVRDSDTARSSFAALMHKARLTRVGIPGLTDIASTASGEAAISSRLSTLSLAESMFNTAIYDTGNGGTNPGETITDAQYNFAGAKDILNAYAEFACAVSDIPATRLLGRAPEGMNSSGDSQQSDWRKKIRAKQTLELQPCMDRLDAYLIPSAIGSRPPEVWADWAPLDTPGEKEQADRWLVQTQAIEKLISTGTIPDEAMAKGVQSLMIDEGYLPELEQALSEMPEDERYGISPEVDPNNPEGGDPDLTGEGGSEPVAEPPRRAANDRQVMAAGDLGLPETP